MTKSLIVVMVKPDLGIPNDAIGELWKAIFENAEEFEKKYNLPPHSFNISVGLMPQWVQQTPSASLDLSEI